MLGLGLHLVAMSPFFAPLLVVYMQQRLWCQDRSVLPNFSFWYFIKVEMMENLEIEA